MPPGTGDIAEFPGGRITTPQPTAQRVARRAALMAAQVDQEVIGVVENMSWFTGGAELLSGGGRLLPRSWECR